MELSISFNLRGTLAILSGSSVVQLTNKICLQHSCCWGSYEIESFSTRLSSPAHHQGSRSLDGFTKSQRAIQTSWRSTTNYWEVRSQATSSWLGANKLKLHRRRLESHQVLKNDGFWSCLAFSLSIEANHFNETPRFRQRWLGPSMEERRSVLVKVGWWIKKMIVGREWMWYKYPHNQSTRHNANAPCRPEKNRRVKIIWPFCVRSLGEYDVILRIVSSTWIIPTCL